jgi:alpha-1,3-glucan synthase
MADLLGFEGFLNSTAPFNPREYKTVWKSDTRYFDFAVGEDYKEECNYPTFYNESGHPVIEGADYLFNQLKGCFDGEFDQVLALLTKLIQSNPAD